eukprot:TRINITY_DN1493_c0_g5_i3.p1 TRINITY_DN1493_c0_g5~~TRINITY_DN1493_c0_g5_i3.p1  ORF type:complete len:433 (-),score=108.31 TRINITY_DN1493_c0_g5_i3:75-1373(-)
MSLVVHSLCPHGLNSFDLCRHTVRSYIDAALNDDLRGFWTMNLSPQTLSPSPYSLTTKESDALSSLVAAGKKALNILLITPTTVFTELQSLPHSVLPLFCSENSEVNYSMLKEFSDKCDAEKPLWMLVLFFFLSKKVDDILASLIKQNQGKNPTVASTISKIGRHYTKSHTFFFHARTILGNRTYMTELLLLLCMTPTSNAEYLAHATAHLHKFEYKDSASNYIRMIQLAHALDLLKNQKSFNRIFELSRTNTFLQHFNRVPIPEKLAVFIEMQGIAKGQSNLDVLMKAFNGPKIYDAITSLATSSIVFDHTGVKTTDDAQNDDHMKDEEGEDLLFVIDQAGDSQGLDDDEEVDVKQENEVSKNIALLLGSMEDSVKDNVIENEELVETQDADAGAPEEPIEIDTGSAKLLTSDAPASSQEEIIDTCTQLDS